MCFQCTRDGDHGQPCPEIEAESDAYNADLEFAASLGEEALEAFHAGEDLPAPPRPRKQAPFGWGTDATDPEIPF